jgi:hypothetical protein
MKLQKLLFMGLFILLLISSGTVAVASDFEWMKNVNIKADVDPSGFRSRLASRFKINDVQIDAVLKTAKTAADAYMVFRMGEMSGRSTAQVMEKYRSEGKKGWGALAQSLGIKPGSKEFKALKAGSDIDTDSNKGKAKNKKESKSKGKGKSKK